MKILHIKNKTLQYWLEILAEVFIIVFVMYFVCWPYAIDGDSMLPGLKTNDRVVMSRLLVITDNFHKNDIVVCKITTNGYTKNIIKRIVGFPGDSVVINEDGVFINGKQLDEPYVNDMQTYGNINIRLGEDEYFVLGDNRNASIDSRSFGPINRKNFVGKIFFKLF